MMGNGEGQEVAMIYSRLPVLPGARDAVEVCVGEGEGVVRGGGEPALHLIVPVPQQLWNHKSQSVVGQRSQ